VRICRESGVVVASKLSVPHPLPPPHVSLTPPYIELTTWIRGLLAANQLTLDQIKALRKPFRVVSASAEPRGAHPRIHRVECIIYPVTNYAEPEEGVEEGEKNRRPKVVISGRLVRQGAWIQFFFFLNLLIVFAGPDLSSEIIRNLRYTGTEIHFFKIKCLNFINIRSGPDIQSPDSGYSQIRL
jgi:hypothetical protein